MIKGLVTITSEKGEVVLETNIWFMVMTNIGFGKLPINPKGLCVYIDGNKVSQPESMKDDT